MLGGDPAWTSDKMVNAAVCIGSRATFRELNIASARRRQEDLPGAGIVRPTPCTRRRDRWREDSNRKPWRWGQRLHCRKGPASQCGV